ncbi:MAG: hypothetical protein ACI89D_002087 [Bermanella sp.]|jgi:hypothetical protein
MSSNRKTTRRTLLRNAFYASAGAGLGHLLGACNSSDSSTPGATHFNPANLSELNIPLGPLANISALGSPDPVTQIAIPAGFAIRTIATSQLPVQTPGALTPFSSYIWHRFPDGGACYSRHDGGWIYTSNSEVPALPLGGCGAIAFNASGEVDAAYPILTQTRQNCAGGKTPWNTWVSCEEVSDGLSYECDPYQAGEGVAKPALGKFPHEAIAVDPINHVIYLTEDAGDGRFYRWIADSTDMDSNGRLRMEHGQLQVMNIAGLEDGGFETDDAALATLRAVSWKNAERPDEAQPSVRSEIEQAGGNAPGTVFDGGEGLWYYELLAPGSPGANTPEGGTVDTRGLVFFTTKGDNRVWALDIENQLVELIFDNSQIEPDFGDVDNLTVSPWGDVLVAEDPPSSPSSRIMIVQPNRQAIPLVEVFHPGSEICGPAFSPDGSRLYFSSQRRFGSGETYELRLPDAIVQSN